MYFAVVILTMLALPIVSVAVQHGLDPAQSLIVLAGHWFVFWGVGVRLMLAGARQVLKPSFTAREIFRMSSEEAAPLVRELGAANIGTAVVALISIAVPSFVLPAAIAAAIFYVAAGLTHAAERTRSLNENVAMVSDLWIALVLVAFVVATFL